MQALPKLPTDAQRSILDKLTCLWKSDEVLPNILKLSDAFFDIWLHDQKVINLLHANIPVADLINVVKKLRGNSEINVLHLPSKVFEIATLSQSLDLLNAVDAVADTLPKLSVLGIHGLKLRSDHIPVLTSMFRLLSGQITGLSLSLKDWAFEGFRGEKFLLEAIGKLYNLEMLVFPEWKKLLKDKEFLLHTLERKKKCLVFVRGTPGKEHLADVAAAAPNLTILSAPFER
jgi:hypothetical protein